MTRQSFSMGHVFSGAMLCSAAGLLALLISGCDDIDQMADNASKRPPVQSLMPPQIENDPEAREHKPATPPAAANPAPATDPNATAQSTPAQPAQPQPAPQQTPPPETAQGNMGVQGQGYGGGIITEPVHEYFGMRQQITWDQIKHDTDIWQAIHNRWPKDEKEFQKEILEPAAIDLPELPKNRKYVYDSKTGELLVGWVTENK